MRWGRPGLMWVRCRAVLELVTVASSFTRPSLAVGRCHFVNATVTGLVAASFPSLRRW